MRDDRQFSNSDEYSSRQQRINTSSYADPYAQLNPYRRRRIWPWLVLVLILVCGVGLATLYEVYNVSRFVISGPQAPPVLGQSAPLAGSTTIAVHSHPTIVADLSVDLIRVHAGQANNQVILGELNAINTSDNNINTSIPYTRNSDDTITITDLSSGELDITVPANTNLKLTADSIEVIGVSGQMNLSSPAGPITVIQSTLSGKSTLDNNGGSINVIQDSLSGQATFTNNGGTIRFVGSIDPQGTYKFDVNGDLLDITLLHNPAFHLDATGIIESVTTNFSEIRVRNTDGSLYEIHQDVGKGPRATITLSVNGTPIVLEKGP
jgi:hypothetical protein